MSDKKSDKKTEERLDDDVVVNPAAISPFLTEIDIIMEPDSGINQKSGTEDARKPTVDPTIRFGSDEYIEFEKARNDEYGIDSLLDQTLSSQQSIPAVDLAKAHASSSNVNTPENRKKVLEALTKSVNEKRSIAERQDTEDEKNMRVESSEETLDNGVSSVISKLPGEIRNLQAPKQDDATDEEQAPVSDSHDCDEQDGNKTCDDSESTDIESNTADAFDSAMEPDDRTDDRTDDADDTKRRVNKRGTDKSSQDAYESILDAFYKKLMDDNTSCSIYFASKHYRRDYSHLRAKHKRDFIEYAVMGEPGTRYAATDYVLEGDDGRTFWMYQGQDGTLHVYGKVEDDDGDGVIMRIAKSCELEEPFDPLMACVYGNDLYIAMNCPTDTSSMSRRLPKYGNETTRSSGNVSIWRSSAYPVDDNVLKPVFDSKDDLNGYCVSLIPETDDGSPGILVVNSSTDSAGYGRIPERFSEMKRYIFGDVGSHVPIGVSVYSLKDMEFDRISVDGDTRWGIGSIEITREHDDKERYDGSGVQKKLF